MPIVAIGLMALFTAVGSESAQAQAGWSDPVELSGAGEGAGQIQAVSTAGDEVVVAWADEAPGGIFPMSLEVAIRETDGSYTRQTLADELAGCVIDIITDGDGNVIVSWADDNGNFLISRKAPGERFGPPENVIPAGSDHVSGLPILAANAEDDLVLQWQSFRNTPSGGEARQIMTRSFDGGPFEEPVAVTPWEGPYRAPTGTALALGPDGEATAVIAEGPLGGGESGEHRVSAAGLAPDGRPLPVEVLERASRRLSCPQVGADAAGNVVALWLDVGCQTSSLVFAQKLSGGSFGTPERVPGSNGVDRPMLQVSPDGRILVGQTGDGGVQVWSGSIGTPGLTLVQRIASGVATDIEMAGANSGILAWSPSWGQRASSARLAGSGRFEDSFDSIADQGQSVLSTDLRDRSRRPRGGGHLSLGRKCLGERRPGRDGSTPPRGPTGGASNPPFPGPVPDHTGPVVEIETGSLRSALRRKGLKVDVKCWEKCLVRAQGALRFGSGRFRPEHMADVSGSPEAELFFPLKRRDLSRQRFRRASALRSGERRGRTRQPDRIRSQGRGRPVVSRHRSKSN